MVDAPSCKATYQTDILATVMLLLALHISKYPWTERSYTICLLRTAPAPSPPEYDDDCELFSGSPYLHGAPEGPSSALSNKIICTILLGNQSPWVPSQMYTQYARTHMCKHVCVCVCVCAFLVRMCVCVCVCVSSGYNLYSCSILLAVLFLYFYIRRLLPNNGRGVEEEGETFVECKAWVMMKVKYPHLFFYFTFCLNVRYKLQSHKLASWNKSWLSIRHWVWFGNLKSFQTVLSISS